MQSGLLALLTCLLLLSACGSLPRPFQPESKVAVDLRAPSTRAPLRVGAPQGAEAGDPKRFSLKVAEQLLTRGIAAEPQWFSMTVAPALETRLLKSKATLMEATEGNERLEVEWRLVSPGGDERELARAQLLLPRGSWREGHPERIEEAAYVNAAAIARALGVSPAVEREAEEATASRLVVLPIEGATGNGAESLEQAILQALGQRGIALAAAPEQQDLLLYCLVDISPVQGNVQLVTIHWQLLEARDFVEIGRVTQENLVPAYSLAGAWREAAGEIAQAAADGILELLQQAGLRDAVQLGSPS